MIVDRGLDEEAAEPKYARVEWERRWLVDPGQRPDPAGQPLTLIEDRYITGTRLRKRCSSADWSCISLANRCDWESNSSVRRLA